MKISAVKIKAIIFDLGNVLLNYDLQIAARRFAKGCRVPLVKVWAHFLTSSIEDDFTCGRISCYEFYSRAKKALGTPVNYRTFCYYWNNIFWENQNINLILRLLKKKYPLYLISNTNKLHFEFIKKKYKILRHFRKMFPSHEMHCRKPQREIYEKVLSKIRFKAEEAIFIDDAPEFVKGARAVGIHAICFRNNQQMIAGLRRYGVKI